MRPKIKEGTILVSIASYRDPICNKTLKSLFENAKNPDKVYVALCQQNKINDDDDCQIDFENNKNIKSIRIPYYEAKGPTWARYLCSTLWNGEEYFMQIDSHTKFVKDWDEKCIKMIKDIISSGESKKPILSHYPREFNDYENYKDSDKTYVPRMCKSFWNNRDMLSFMGAETKDTHNKPYKTPYIAAGMVFCNSNYLNDVPYDPNLPYLFVGEEILHSIRAYTHGWDVYTPTENIIFHEYTRSDKPKIWTDNPTYSDMQAFEKVKYYIGLVKDDTNLTPEVKLNLDKYGLGNVRTLKDYYKFAGIDTDKKIVTTNFCKDGNKATEDDIVQSNEKNHVKEGFTFLTEQSMEKIFLIIIIILIVLIILLILFGIKLFKNKIKNK